MDRQLDLLAQGLVGPRNRASDPENVFSDVGPRTRSTGRATAREAAEQLDQKVVGRRCRKYLMVIREAGSDGATRDEIARKVGAVGAEDRALSRRLTDLLHAELIEDSGRTRLSESLRRQVAWTCTPKGRLEAGRAASALAQEAQ